MSFKLRNTLVLAGVFVLITGVGLFYWMFYQPKELDASLKDITRMEKELQEMPTLINEVEILTQQEADTRRRYNSRSKEIPTSDISSMTYAYMSRGIDVAGSLQFNMRYAGEQLIEDYGINTYELTGGTATFPELYRFVYFLENGRRLYKIRYLNMEQQESVDAETGETKSQVTFTMELRAFFSKIDVLSTSLAATELAIPRPPFNPFTPLIYTTVATQAPPNEIDVNALDVKAVLPGKAFVLVDKELIVLHVGDKVWRGSVARISPAESLVEFTLDEGGIIKRVQKKIVFEAKKR
jgi:hypothetical protein